MPDLYDMQSQVSFMVSRFQDAIKQFEEQKKYIENIKVSFDSLAGNVGTLQKSNSDLLEKLAFVDKKSSDFCSLSEKRFENSKLAYNSILDNHSLLSKVVDDIKKLILSIEDKAYSLLINQNNLAKIADISDLKDKFESEKKNIQEKFSLSEQSNQALRVDQIKLKHDHNDVLFSMSSINKELESFRDLAHKNSMNLDSLREKSKQDLDSIKSFVIKHVSDQLAVLPKPPAHLSLVDAQNAMQGKLEPVSLDAKNANLRSVNNESKIIILEKKLEQLQLLVNKLQLQG